MRGEGRALHRRHHSASWLALAAGLAALLVAAPVGAQPALCRVGVYVLSLSPVHVETADVRVDAIVWMRCPIAVTRENMALSIMGASEDRRAEAYVEESGGERYFGERVRATLRVPLSLRSYPFDTQRVRVVFEATNATVSEVHYALDDVDPTLRARPCCLDEAVSIPNWRIVSSVPRVGFHRYRTRFGYTFGQADAAAYPHFHVELTLRRDVRPYLWKTLLPLAIILAMAWLRSFWHPARIEAAASALSGALLAVVLLHLAQRGELPHTGYLVTGDLFFLHAYLMLLLMLAAVTRAHHAENAGEHDEALWLQRAERRVVPALTLVGWGLIALLG